jgi:hypothetical protein
MVSAGLALIVISGYLLDAAGGGVAPTTVSLLSAAMTLALLWLCHRSTAADSTDTLAWLGIVVLVLVAIASMGGPSLLLPGRGPDLTHHLLLVDYIDQHRQLVHDRSLDGTMGEMAHYTPGAHLLAVIIGALFGVEGWRAFFPLLALCAALTAGFVYLIARRLALPVPYAICAVLLLFLPAQYFYGAFTHDGFLAQAAATFFAVAAWWALSAWDENATPIRALLFSIFLAATFLTWPVFIGPLLLVFAGALLAPSDPPQPWRSRMMAVVIGLAPLVVVAAVHVTGRTGWLAIVRTSGAILQPSFDSLGWLLPLLSLLGIHISIRERRARITIVLLFAILLQGLTLFVMAKTQGADTPYMAFKMVYLAIYPLAVLGAVGVSIIRRVAGNRDTSLAWAVATILVVVAVRPALIAPRALPVVDLDLYAAGKWTRAMGGEACVDYLVSDAQTAYWLHLAVLGNPRAAARMEEIDRYDPRAAMGRWIAAEGRVNAIADLRLLPDELRRRVEITKTFGSAAVIRRPETAADGKMGDCDLGR